MASREFSLKHSKAAVSFFSEGRVRWRINPMSRFRRKYGYMFLVVVALCWFTLTAGPGQAESPHPTATLNAGYPQEAFTEVDLKDAQAALEMWTKQVSKNTEIPMTNKVSIYPDETAIIQAIKRKELDLVIMSSLLYLKIKEAVPLEPIFVPSYKNIIGDEFLLLVHRDAGITRLKQLQNRTILIQTKISPTSVHTLWLNSLLREEGLPAYERLFRSAKSVDKPSQAILPVFFKRADACLVMRRTYETVAELNPQIAQELVAIAHSPPILRGIILFRKDYNDRFKQVVTKSLAGLDTHPQGRQILTLLKYDQLVPFKPDYLKSIESFCDFVTQAQKISQKR